MSSLPKENAQLKRLVDLFRLILTKDTSAISDVKETLRKEPELLTRELTFTCGSIFDFADTHCACVLDHENFRYISGTKLDEEVLDRIARSVLSGQCAHHDSLPEEDEETVGPLPTSVTLAHAAAVVGYVPVLKILLQVADNAPLTHSLRSSPLHLALLFKQQPSVDAITESTAINLESYCGRFNYNLQNKNRPNSINIDYMSTIQLCMMMENSEVAKHILQQIPLQANWIVDALTSKSDEAYKLISQYIHSKPLSKLRDYEANSVMHHGIRRGELQLVEKLMEAKENGQFKHSPLLLAIIYDQPKILEHLLTTQVCKKDENILGYTPIDISNSLNHSACSTLLSDHGMKPTECHQETPLRVMLEIGKQLQLGQHTNDLIRKVGCNNNLKGISKEISKWSESLTFLSLRKFGGLGVRGLLSLCRDIDANGPDGLTPLALSMKHKINPVSVIDVLYFNPFLNQFEQKGIDRSHREKHLELFDRSKIKHISMLALAIERDLKNYSVQKWALEYAGFTIYDGSIAVLLLDCGYDIRADDLIHSSYSKLLQRRGTSGTEDEIRSRIKQRIDRELYFPKPLKERSRDVLRRHFTGHSLHRYIASVNIPMSVREFVLMEFRLTQIPRSTGLIHSVEAD